MLIIGCTQNWQNLLTCCGELEYFTKSPEAAMHGGGRGIRGSVGQLSGERRDVREGRSAP